MKTVCLITNWYPTENNPLQGIFFKEQLEALKHNYHFIVIHYNFDIFGIKHVCRTHKISNYVTKDKKLDNGIEEITYNVYQFKYKNIAYMNEESVNSLVEAIKNDNLGIDMMYCICAQSEAGLTYKISKGLSIPYIVSEHAPFVYPGTTLTNINKIGIENAKALLLISNDKLRQIMMQNVSIPKTYYVGNLVDEREFYINRKKHGITTFIVVAAYNYYKNYQMIIDIFERVKKKTKKPFKLMIVGYDCNKTYAKNAEELEKKIENSKIRDYVEMIPFVDRKDMCMVYNRADCFVMTSIQEGMPVSSLEAACCGLPIYSTRCGGVEDFVDESIGKIYNINDIEGFSSGIIDYINRKAKYNSKNIRNSVIKKYGINSFVNNMTNAFEYVLGANK